MIYPDVNTVIIGGRAVSSAYVDSHGRPTFDIDVYRMTDSQDMRDRHTVRATGAAIKAAKFLKENSAILIEGRLMIDGNSLRTEIIATRIVVLKKMT